MTLDFSMIELSGPSRNVSVDDFEAAPIRKLELGYSAPAPAAPVAAPAVQDSAAAPSPVYAQGTGQLMHAAGKAMFACRWEKGMPWHKAGSKIDGDASRSVPAAIRAASMTDLVFETAPAEFKGSVVKDVNLVLANGRPLPGVAVGSKFHVMQPLESFMPVQEMLDSGKYAIDTIGAAANFSRLWMRVEAEPCMFRGERLLRAALICYGNDGSMAWRFVPSMVREVCINTVNHSIRSGMAAASEKGGNITIRHTRTYPARLQAFAKAFSACEGQWADLVKMFDAFASTAVHDAAVKAFAEGMFPNKSKVEGRTAPQTETARRILLDAFESAPGQELASARGTVWGLYNAATWVADWERKTRGLSGDVQVGGRWYSSAIEGAGVVMRDKAAELCVRLVRAA